MKLTLCLCLCRRPQVCGCPSDSWERQPWRWQNIPVLQRECYGWRACWEGHTCSHRTAMQSTLACISNQPHIDANVHTNWLPRRQNLIHTHTFIQTLYEMAFISGKILDGCLSGFHNGRYWTQWLFLARRRVGFVVLCIIAPEDRNLRGNVKCHQNLRGKDAIKGSTVKLMPGFGTDWVLYRTQL